MSLKTRLDGRSSNNNILLLKDDEGNLLAEIKLLDEQSCTLEIVTSGKVFVEKNNGWSSLKHKGT